MALTTTHTVVGGVPPSTSQTPAASAGALSARDQSESHWARRWIVGFMAALLLVGGAGSTWHAPKAEAQALTGIAAAIATAEGANQLCEAIYGSEGLRDCLDKGVEDIGNITELAKCVSESVGKGNEGTGTDTGNNGDGGEDGETPAPGEGDDERKQADSALKECMDKLKEDDEEDDSTQKPDDYSLYRMSSALTAFYVNSLIPGGGEDASTGGDDTEGGEGTESEASAGLDAWRPILGADNENNSNGSAGAFVAAPSKDFLENKNWLLGSGDAKNDAVFSYKSFERKQEAPDAGVSNYVYYGAALSGLGFDNTSARDSMDTARNKAMGYGVMATFVGAGFVDTLFDGIVNILAKTNPFGIMVDAITPHTNATFTEGMRSDAVDEDGNFNDLKKFIGRMYDGFVQIGWLVTIPVFIGLAIAGMLLSRRYAVGDGLKKIFIRVGFLVVGIPLLGVTYTAGLESMQGAGGDAASANAAKIVNSTYVDFESWVNESRLAMPEGTVVTWDKNNSKPSATAEAAARESALKINTSSNEDLRDVTKVTTNGDSDDFVSAVVKDKDTSSQKVNASTLGMLNRYISGDTISSASYESQVKAELTRLANDPDSGVEPSEVLGWVKDFTSADSIASMSAKDVQAMTGKDVTKANPVIQVAPNSGIRVLDYDAPTSSSSEDANERNIQFLSNGDSRNGCSANLVTSRQDDQSAGSPGMCNMSPLAMYNYLNTSFDNTSATAFSPDNSTSAWTREQHQSVNAIGSGMMSFIYWFSAIVLLGSFALIGFIYGLAMMFNIIKRSVLLIAAVPFATMGFIAGITKVIVYTIAMFLELFMTLFVYKVVQEFLMTIPSLIEKPIVGMASESSKTIAVMGVTVLCSIAIIIFTVIAVKLRSSLTQAMDEASTNAINKVVGTGVSSASDPSSGGGLKAGIARGAAMGAASKMMSGGSDGGEAVADSVDASGADMNGAAVAGSGAGTALGTDTDPQGMDSDNADADGSGIIDPNAANADAGQGQLPAGEYNVDGDGDLTDADGNPVMNADGSNANISDVAGTDSDGYITDGNGQPVIGENGEPIHSSDAQGIDRHGNLMGKDGALTDQNGNFIRAGGAGSVDDNATGGASSLIGDTSTDADEATAAAMADNGGLDASQIQSSSDLPAADASGGDTQFGTALGGGGQTAGAAAAGAAAMNAANGYANSSAASQGAQDVINGAQGNNGAATAFQQANGNAQVVSGGTAGQVAPQQLGAQPAQAPGTQAPQGGQQGGSAPAGASGGAQTSGGDGPNPMMGFVGMQMANQAANKVTGQTKAGKTIHESVTGARGGGGQPASGGGAPMSGSPRQKRGGQGSRMATMAGMHATNGGDKSKGPRRSRANGSGNESSGSNGRDGLHSEGTGPQRGQGPSGPATGNGMSGQ